MNTKNSIFLAVSAIVVALAAAVNPLAVFVFLAAAGFCWLAYTRPPLALAVVIFSTLAGEFLRIEIGGFSLLVVDLLAPATLAIWLARKLIRKEKIELDRTSAALLIFWAIAAVSILVGAAELSGGELKTAVAYLLRFVAVSGLFFVARDSRSEDAKIVNSLVATGILLAISGFFLLKIFYDFTEAGFAAEGWDPHIGRLTSTWLDPNFAGVAFAFVLAFVGGKFLAEKNFLRQLGWLGVAGILAAGLLATFSRSGLLAAGVAGILLGLIRSRTLLLAVVVVGILGILGVPRLRDRAAEFWQSASSLGTENSIQIPDPTAQLRLDSWNEGIRIWQENPVFGVGFGGYAAHQTFASEDSHAATGSDSSLLNVAATTGTLGLFEFLIFLALVGVDGWNRRKTTAGIGVLAGGAGLLAASFFVNAIFFPPLAAMFFVTAGLAKTTDCK